MSEQTSYHSSAPPGKTLSPKRLKLFKVISLLMPVLFLLLLELILRLFNYGFNPDLFIEYPSDNRYLVLNPDASKKYFINQAIATTGNIEPFKKEKDDNTLRIFVLGESTTIGYPYFHNGSFHRWLLYRLMHSLPDKNFEIINLSLTAVNSYTVLGFAKEVINYKPDAIMIYTGHNEYYGALGVGSTARMGGSPAVVNITLALRKLKLVQLMTNAYESVAGLFESSTSKSGKTRMELMVKDQQIPYASDLFNRGIAQFSTNLDNTLKLFNDQHVPVFISNLVSNEKDLKPFADNDSDSSRISSFQKNYSLGLEAFKSSDSASALNYFKQANSSYPSHASCNYYLGRLAYNRGAYQEARGFFEKAKDLDALRFRAPEKMNEIINQLCSKYNNAHLVDTKKAFDSLSKENIIGNELILEHVHPNLKGYALLSDAFYKTLKKENIFSIPRDKELSFEDLLTDMPITTMDSLTGAFKIEHLRKSWPFYDTPPQVPDSSFFHTEEEKLAFAITFQRMSWTDATESLYQYYISNHDLIRARILTETLVLEHPTEEAYYTNAANICGELKDYKNAVFYFKKSFDFTPTFNKAKYLFVMYFMLDSPEEAMPYLDYAISNGNASLRNIKILATEVIQLKNTFLKNDPTNIDKLNQVAAKYLKMGNKEGAEKYSLKVLQLDKQNAEALLLNSQLKNKPATHEIH